MSTAERLPPVSSATPYPRVRGRSVHRRVFAWKMSRTQRIIKNMSRMQSIANTVWMPQDVVGGAMTFDGDHVGVKLAKPMEFRRARDWHNPSNHPRRIESAFVLRAVFFQQRSAMRPKHMQRNRRCFPGALASKHSTQTIQHSQDGDTYCTPPRTVKKEIWRIWYDSDLAVGSHFTFLRLSPNHPY